MRNETRRSSWRGWLPDLGAALSRHPLAVILAALLTLYKLWADNPGEAELKVLGTLAGAFLWVVAVDFFAESHGSTRLARVLAWLAGILAIALLFHFQWELWLLPPLLLGAIVLLVGLSGHLLKGERNATFWLFNHRLWLAASLALIGAGLFGAGLSVILKTLNFLFGLELSWRWQDRIWTVALGFLAPVSWLALAPRSFTESGDEREETEFTTRAVASLVKFVLVPLLLVYTAILYAYAIKIGLAGTLPKGTLGSMIVGYLLVGAATLLLAYPTREDGGVLVRLFWRYWVWLALMPVLLLFLAIATRIKAYGITEERYLIVLVGVWSLILAGLRIARPGSFDLRLVPGVLAVLLVLASFGPWGAIGLSVASQKAALARILSAKGVLVDGKIVPRPKSADNPLGTEAARVHGLELYLNTHHALDEIAAWFADLDPNPFAPGKTPEQSSREVLEALSLRAGIPLSMEGIFLTHYAGMPEVVSLGSGGYVVGPVLFQGSGGLEPAPIPGQSVRVEGLGTVRLELSGTMLTAGIDGGPELHFDIMPSAREVANLPGRERRPLRLEASAGNVEGVLLIDNLNGSYKEPGFNVALLRLWLIVRPKG